jgi:hypothetical protein
VKGYDVRDTVCIVGSHPQTRDLIPWDDDVDIWTINEEFGKSGTWVKRSDSILQMHPRAIWDNPLNRNDPNHGKWLKTQDLCDVWMLEQFPDVPRCRKYPLEEISKKFLSHLTINVGPMSRKEYMQTTAAHAVALALYLGYKKIKIYGIELIIDSEYRFQRPSFMYWFGIAVGTGVEVEYNGFAFDGAMYGYEADGTVTRDQLVERRKDIEQYTRPRLDDYNQVLKGLGDAMSRYVENGFKADADIIENAVRECVQKMNDYSINEGAKQHLDMYIDRAEKMIEAGGEARFSHHEFERDANTILKAREPEIINYSIHAGKIDALWNILAAEKMQSRRRRAMKEFDDVLKEYLKATAKTAMHTGAFAETRRLQQIIRDMMIVPETTNGTTD